MVKNVFIDTNSWLSFYIGNIKSPTLEKLLKKIEKKEINLLIPEPQIDEILRNKEVKISKEIEKINKFISSLKEIKNFPEGLKEDFDSFIKKLEKNVEEYKEKAYSEKLETDNILKEIFSKAKKLETTPEIINLSKERTLIRGNPPRKDIFKSCADAIIWETLLKNANKKEELIIISNDGDYNSEIDENKIRLFLKKEWETKKESKIILYKTIASFLQEEFKGMDIKPEEIKSEEESSKSISPVSLTYLARAMTPWDIVNSTYPSDNPWHSELFNPEYMYEEKAIVCSNCKKSFSVKEKKGFVSHLFSQSYVCPYCGRVA